MSLIDFITRALIFSLAAGALASWIWCLHRWRAGLEPVPFEPRRPVPWTAVDIIPVLLWLGLALAAMAQQLQDKGDVVSQVRSLAEQIWRSGSPFLEMRLRGTGPALLLAADVVTKLLIGGVLLALILVRHRTTAADLGWVPSRLRADTRLGVGSFYALGVVVFGISLVLTNWSGDKNIEHPLVIMLRHDHSLLVVVWACLSAIVVAPLVEEFMFRVVLQGWLEKIWPVRTSADGSRLSQSRFQGFLPILISASLFALMHLHFQAGRPNTDPIPLFVLALGLGFVYRQTHRIWPSLVVHALLNSYSMLMAILTVTQ
ncbi:MAG TPA: CPBP family intramembrane glutamic endopeptidase [Pirellulales bacterium]|jgi:membrane protease YdiL (CAAX protease family)|nr:CPBP family intramembrane glutamic endopeptidase [Pirellulales bacterium]